MKELRTSDQWLEKAKKDTGGLTIIDYDGWDKADIYNSFYVEKITEQEFYERLVNSTIILSNVQQVGHLCDSGESITQGSLPESRPSERSTSGFKD